MILKQYYINDLNIIFKKCTNTICTDDFNISSNKCNGHSDDVIVTIINTIIT